MNQSGSTKAWPLVGGIAAALLALNQLLWVFDQGVSGAIPYIYILGMILAALAGFLSKNEQAAKYLQVAAAALLVIYFGRSTLNFMELSQGGYAPASLAYGHVALTAACVIVGVTAFVRTAKPTFLIVNAVLSLVMFLMLFQYLGAVGFLGTMGRTGGTISLLLYVLILMGLAAPRVAEEKAAPAPVGSTIGSLGVADELLKYKQLLDQGVLTEEEYEEKKKKLLGL